MHVLIMTEVSCIFYDLKLKDIIMNFSRQRRESLACIRNNSIR